MSAIIRELPPDVDYRGYPAVSQSDLKRCWSEPELYYQESIAKTRRREETDAMKLGTAIEHYIKYDAMPENVIVIPPEVLSASGSRAGKAWKEWEAAQPAGSLLLKHAEFEAGVSEAADVAKQIDSHEMARSVTGRHLEVAERLKRWNRRFVFSYEDVEIKCEMDILMDGLVADLKSTADVHAGPFARRATNLGYDLQAYVYSLAAAIEKGCDVSDIDYVWVCVRSSYPYNVETFVAPDEMIDIGRKKFHAYLEFWRECADSGRWRTRTHGKLIDLTPPRWAAATLSGECLEGFYDE